MKLDRMLITQMLEALEQHCGNYKLAGESLKQWTSAVDAAREYLAAPEQSEYEGVVIEGYESERIIHWRDGFTPSVGTKLYRHPAPKAEPVNHQLLEALIEARQRLVWFVDSYPHDITEPAEKFFKKMNAAIAAADQLAAAVLRATLAERERDEYQRAADDLASEAKALRDAAIRGQR